MISDFFLAFHKFFFTTFLLTSTVYMALSIYLLGKRVSTPSALESQAFRYKKRLFVTTLLAVMGAIYFFARHNKYCEPLSKFLIEKKVFAHSCRIGYSNKMSLTCSVYTWFAVCEYIVIVCNMAFHITSYWDFPNREWTLRPSPVLHQQFRV